MEFPKLREMCDLINIYSTYTSHTAIAKRIGISEVTLRGYWERYGGNVPDKHLDQFAALLQEIVPALLTPDAALNLFKGSQLVFHSMLLPIEGRSWRKLMDEQVLLEVRERPPFTLGFGEVEGEDMPLADETIALGNQFRFHGTMPWAAEGFLAAEHRGEWHLLPLDGSLRSFELDQGAFDLPVSKKGKARYLVEKEKPGFYHYIVIAQKNALSDIVRHHIQQTNPYSQLNLDLLASAVLQTDPANRIVLAASLRVTSS